MLPAPQMVVQEGDLVQVMVRRSELATVEAVFASGPKEAS
jgi:trk system potassium uptake protein TrkA